MTPGTKARLLSAVAALALAWSFAPAGARAQQPGGGCASCATCGTGGGFFATSLGSKCCSHDCPPHYHHCAEGAPKIKFHHGCPKPICSPCSLPHWGHYQTCWSPWPFPPDWSHCASPPPAALVNLNSPPSNVFGSSPYGAVNTMPYGGDRAPTLPAPRTTTGR